MLVVHGGDMPHFAEGIARFQREVFPAKAGLFARLATVHRPGTLFIGCSDARVVPELITQTDPGELFVIRNAGNLVPAHTPGADGVTASVEYAVAVLGVRDIVVCGHSACGAMTALAEGHDLSAAPAVAAWLRHADASLARTAAAGGVPADDDVPHAEDGDGVLDTGGDAVGARGVGGDQVSRGADDEEFAGVGLGDEFGYDAGVRAADEQGAGAVDGGQAGEEPCLGGEDVPLEAGDSLGEMRHAFTLHDQHL